jgi:hypothetical protein
LAVSGPFVKTVSVLQHGGNKRQRHRGSGHHGGQTQHVSACRPKAADAAPHGGGDAGLVAARQRRGQLPGQLQLILAGILQGGTELRKRSQSCLGAKRGASYIDRQCVVAKVGH